MIVYANHSHHPMVHNLDLNPGWSLPDRSRPDRSRANHDLNHGLNDGSIHSPIHGMNHSPSQMKNHYYRIDTVQVAG